jgi:PKD repeat protein
MKYQSTGGELRRVRYTGAGNTPPVVIVEATPTIGVAPLSVSFDGSASYDPDAQDFSYDWDFDDGASSSAASPSHVYQEAGVYDAVLTLTEETAPFASSSDTVRITVGTSPPLATILAPVDGDSYRVGDEIDFAARATAGAIPSPRASSPGSCGRCTTSTPLRQPRIGRRSRRPEPQRRRLGAEDHGDDVRFQLCVTATVGPSPSPTPSASTSSRRRPRSPSPPTRSGSRSATRTRASSSRARP